MEFSSIANQQRYPFTLPELPYKDSTFNELLTQDTFNYHHTKHHAAYVKKLNELLQHRQDLQEMSLEDLMIKSEQVNDQKIFNNAAQVWNHTFYWHSITPEYYPLQGKLLERIEKDFINIENFYEQFCSKGLTQFGSGWVWLVYKQGKLSIKQTSNADNPITADYIPLLTCDVWEHAYYIDYRNDRAKYLEKFVNKLINWQFVLQNLEKLH